jgi:hypothetical protein
VKNRFLKLLFDYAVIFLALSVILFAVELWDRSTQSVTTISSIESNITQTLKSEGMENLTELERLQYHDSVLTKLIDWGGQGTISWGVTFLAAITVFFMILLELRPKENEKLESVLSKRSDIALAFLAAIFLIFSVASIFEILYYYRYVANLQNDLLTIPVSQGPIYPFIVNFGWVELTIIAMSIIAVIVFCWAYKKEDC